MKEINIFNRSFKFDTFVKEKARYLLRKKTPNFKILPISLIRDILSFISGKKVGFYYYIKDNSEYPNKINKYVGKIIEHKHNDRDKMVKYRIMAGIMNLMNG